MPLLVDHGFMMLLGEYLEEAMYLLYILMLLLHKSILRSCELYKR